MKYFLTLFMISILFFGCEKNTEKELTIISIQAQKTISQLNDTTFLSQVLSIKHHNGLLFISDMESNMVYCLDTSLQYLKTYGHPGKGPGELIGTSGCLVQDDKLFVLNFGNLRINQYDLSNGNFIVSTPIERTFYDKGYQLINHVFYGSLWSKENPPLCIIDMEGNIIQQFGNQEYTVDLNQGLPKQYLLEYEKSSQELMAISTSEPVIEKYNLNGELLGIYDFSAYQPFTDLIRHGKMEREQNINMKNASFVFFADSYYTNGKLYLMAYSHDFVNNEPNCNILVEFEVGSQEINPIRIINLENQKKGWYHAFTIYDNNIIAYDAISHEIHQFVLPPL